MKNQHPLDELIRQRINELPPTPPRGWEALRDKLDAPPPTDALLAGKLAGLTPAIPPGSWQAMESKLAAAETSEQESIDELVTSALDHATPAVSSGWALLAARLELTGKRREMVASVKLTEGALLLTLLLALVRFGPNYSTQSTVAYADAALSAFPLGVPVEAEQSALRASTSTNQTRFVRSVSATHNTTQTVPVTPLTFSPTPLPVASVIKLPQIKTLNTPPIGLTEIADLDVSPTPVTPPLEFPSLLNGQPIRYYLNLFASPVDINQVVTRENQVIGIAERQSNLSTSYSVGALIDVVQGENSVQTGLMYGYRSYVPVEFLLIGDRQETKPGEKPVRFGRLRYRTVSVPLTYNRALYRSDKWRISGGLGIAMNVILGSDFKLDDGRSLEDLERAWQEYLQNRGEGSGRSSDSHNLLAPPAGYLEGGSLIENSSLYVSGHLRFERLLDDRWSLYLAPTVTRLVTVREDDGGKGPLQDRIHNTMLRFGTRVRLSDK